MWLRNTRWEPICFSCCAVVPRSSLTGTVVRNKATRKLVRASFFGEMAFVTKERRSATVRAMESLKVIRIGEVPQERIRRRYPRIAEKIFYNIAQLLSERLRRTTHRE